MKKQDELGDWVQLISQLDPLQTITIIGLLEQNKELKPDDIIVNKIIGEAKVSRTQNWFTKNFRKLMYSFCELKEKIGGNDPTVQSLANHLLTITGFTTSGPIVAFSFWLLNHSTERWCKVYEAKTYEGNGQWVPFKNDLNTSEGYFQVSHKPGKSETVRTKQKDKLELTVNIVIPAEIKGSFESNVNVTLTDAHIDFIDRNQNLRIIGSAEDVTRVTNNMIDFDIKRMNTENYYQL